MHPKIEATEYEDGKIRDFDINGWSNHGIFSVFRAWMTTYRGVSKENLYLYCAQYNFLRNTREEDRAKRAATIAINTLTNIEEEPCHIALYERILTADKDEEQMDALEHLF